MLSGLMMDWRFIQAATHSLTLHCSPLPAEDILQLGEMLDERHHLSLEALGVDILHRRHLQQHFNVKLPCQVRIRLAIPARITAEAGGQAMCSKAKRAFIKWCTYL